MRIGLLARSPILMSIFPFGNDTNFDKPVNNVIEPLEDKLGWDRVKNIFHLKYVSVLYYQIFTYCIVEIKLVLQLIGIINNFILQ